MKFLIMMLLTMKSFNKARSFLEEKEKMYNVEFACNYDEDKAEMVFGIHCL